MTRRPPGLPLAAVLEFYRVPILGSTNDCVRPIGLSGPQKNGYWHIHFAGRTTHLHGLILLYLGSVLRAIEVAPGDQARHSCGNKWCVNPSHIVPGTIGDNMADQFRLGERVMNERHPNCRLSTSDATAIRDAHATESSRDLADRFGVSVSYVNQIRAGSRRRYLGRAAA